MRPDHAANNHHVFAWDAPPATGHPGHDYNCRCYAEPFTPISPNGIDDPPIESVPIEALIPVIALRRVLVQGTKRIIEATRSLFKTTPNPKDILTPGGKPIGTRGNRSDIRVVKGGKNAADKLYDSFGKGKPDTPPRYPGEGKRLPNGDWIGRRPISKHGEPAIDLDVKDIPYKKVKFPN